MSITQASHLALETLDLPDRKDGRGARVTRSAPRHDDKPALATTPAGYRGWSAAEKADWLWNVLVVPSAHRPSDLPALRLPFKTEPRKELAVVLRRGELDKALTRTDDLMEAGRPKVIHAHGTVAAIDLRARQRTRPTPACSRPPPHGGAIGVLRLSLVAKVSERTAYTPALALKLLIDGGPSADLLAMNHTVGQGRDFDLFSNSMTNDLSEEHSELRLPQRVMSVLFGRVSTEPRRLVVDHLAGQHRDGSAVPDPVVPGPARVPPDARGPPARSSARRASTSDWCSPTVPAGTTAVRDRGAGRGRAARPSGSCARRRRSCPATAATASSSGMSRTPATSGRRSEADRRLPVLREHPGEAHRRAGCCGSTRSSWSPRSVGCRSMIASRSFGIVDQPRPR